MTDITGPIEWTLGLTISLDSEHNLSYSNAELGVTMGIVTPILNAPASPGEAEWGKPERTFWIDADAVWDDDGVCDIPRFDTEAELIAELNRRRADDLHE